MLLKKKINRLKDLQVLLYIKNDVRSASKMSYNDVFGNSFYRSQYNRSLSFFYRTINHLERKGLVRIREKLGREKIYELTDEGEKVLEELKEFAEGDVDI